MSNDWLMLQTNTAQSKISTASVPFGALPTLAGPRRRGRFLGLVATIVAVTLSLGCSSKLTVTTVGGLKKAATQSFKVTALSKIVATPGEILTITGTGFQPSLNLSSVSGLNLADVSGPAVNARLEVQGGDKATLTLPSSLSFGKYVLTLRQEGDSQQITLFSNGGKTDYPIITAAADEICVGKKFYDETSTLREGTKVCSLPLPDCSEDGAKACTATSSYPAAAATGLADKVVSGQTVAGVTGNITLPDPTKVRVDNGPFGIAGSSLTPTLANCAVDGATNCVAVADFPAAKLANFSNGDVRTGVTVAGISGALSGAPAACASDGAVGCLSTSTYAAALTTNLAPKVLAGNIVAGVPGSATPESHINCAMDGATGCVAVSSYAAAAISGLANKVLSGSTVAGVAGNVTLPDPTKVRIANGTFGVAGTGSTPTLADCSADGGTSCVAVANFTAAATSGLAAKVLGGNTVAGILGTATAESHSNCSADGATGCVAVTNFPAVDKITKLTTGNIKKDVVIAGVTGDYPSSTHPLTGADGTADLPTFTSANGGGSYQWFKSDGTRLSGTVEANASVTPGTVSQVLNAGLYRQVTVAGDANLVANNIKTGTTIFTVTGNVIPTAPPCLIDGGTDCVASPTFTAAATSNLAGKVLSGNTVAGIAGNVTLPDPAKVRVSNGTYGIAGTGNTPTLADCSSDGGTSCVAVANFTAAATSGLAPKVVSGYTVAGIAGSATAESHSNCAADGATGCISVANYTAAATSGLASKVLSSSTVAGIAGNVTLPAQGKVYTGIQYGVSGTGLTGTLTIPLASNVISSSPAYGDPGAPVTPNFDTSAIYIYVRPAAPTITATAFNFSPDRITLTWNAVSNASGYLVLMNNSTPVTWKPSDFTTYTTGSAGSDTIAYVGTSTNPTISTTITAGTTFYFAIYTYQANNVYSDAPTTKTVLSCAGLAGGTWVAVPGDSVYATNGFCVQKYVPSSVSSVPKSQAATAPWTNITQSAARTACTGLGAGYHLITNPEWMTIAANIAKTATNWSSGTQGSGTLSRGHSDRSPDSVCPADANDSKAWVETDCTGQTQGVLNFNQRRTQYLSNNEVIWDIGGNLSQWVDYNNLSDKPVATANTQTEYSNVSLAVGTTTTPRSHLVPIAATQTWWNDSWDSTVSIGKYNSGINGTNGGLLRGGTHWSGIAAGPFSVQMDNPLWDGAHALGYLLANSTNTGLRCTWSP